MSLDYQNLMQHAINLAKLAKGQTHPNPMVGALIVDYDGKILAEGFHKKAGEAHAEVNALKNLKYKNISSKGLTMIVTLEPCNHYGKTPPCTKAIIEAGLKKVVFGTKDTNQALMDANSVLLDKGDKGSQKNLNSVPLDKGDKGSQNRRGLNPLADAGIEVIQDVLESECRLLNRFFFSGVERKRPWVIAKWAMTLDGKIASKTGDSFWITSEESRQLAQELRAEAGAVLVGSGTILKDDPLLNYRGKKQLLQPKRIILDLQNRIPQSAKIFESVGGTVIVVKRAAQQTEIFRREIKREATNELAELSEIFVGKEILADNAEFLRKLMEFLFAEFSIHGLVVEGGTKTLTSFFNANLVDEVNVFIAPKIIGGSEAKSALAGRGISKMSDALLLTNVKYTPLNNAEILIQSFLTDSSNTMFDEY